MSNSDVPPATPEIKSDQQPACGNGCNYRGAGILRAVMYAPVFLLVGGMAALATFPNLAEYASPLIGESSGSSAASRTTARLSGAGCQSCPLSRLLSAHGFISDSPAASDSTSDASLSATPAGACSLGAASCCSMAEDIVIETRSSIDAELTAVETDGAAKEITGDAISTAEVVEVKTPAN